MRIPLLAAPFGVVAVVVELARFDRHRRMGKRAAENAVLAARERAAADRHITVRLVAESRAVGTRIPGNARITERDALDRPALGGDDPEALPAREMRTALRRVRRIERASVDDRLVDARTANRQVRRFRTVADVMVDTLGDDDRIAVTGGAESRRRSCVGLARTDFQNTGHSGCGSEESGRNHADENARIFHAAHYLI